MSVIQLSASALPPASIFENACIENCASVSEAEAASSMSLNARPTSVASPKVPPADATDFTKEARSWVLDGRPSRWSLIDAIEASASSVA